MPGSKKPDAALFNKDSGFHLGYSGDAAKVWVVGSSAGASIQIVFGSTSDKITSAVTNLTTSTNATVALVAAPGATTDIQIRGWSVANYGTIKATVELRWGTTAFFRTGLAAGSGGGVAYNWNKVGGYNQATNKKLVAYHIGNTTTIWTVDYTKV